MCWCLNGGQYAHTQALAGVGLWPRGGWETARLGHAETETGPAAWWAGCLGFVVICYCACPHVLGAINLALLRL